MIRIPFGRTMAALAATALLASCTGVPDEIEAKADLGEFRLGHLVVVADDATVGPLSKSVSEEQWETIMDAAMEERFGRYDGGRFYHMGVKIVGYVVAAPGVPVLASPKSVLVVVVNIWDDAEGVKLTSEPKQITILEALTPEGMIGSGLTMSAEEQMTAMARIGAREIQQWLEENPEWFNKPAVIDEAEPEDGLRPLSEEAGEAAVNAAAP